MRDRRRAYTPTEVAHQLGVNPESVRRWVRRGWLRAAKLGHCTIRITPADLQDFLAAHRVGMGRPRQTQATAQRRTRRSRAVKKGGERR